LNVKYLKLVNFRNYEKLEMEFEDGFNILYGQNAQGKTNVLEAVFLCSSGRSHRTAKDHDIVKIGKDEYGVKLLVGKKDTETLIEVTYKKDEKKKVRINEIPVQKIGSLMGCLNTVMFSPEDLLIIKEGPQERRRFLDITISQLKPSYFYNLQQYARVLEQRNSLLKRLQYAGARADTLEVWNKSLAETGAKIIKTRAEFIRRLNIKVGSCHGRLTAGNEKLEMEYAPSVEVDEGMETGEIEEVFVKTMEREYRKEIEKGSTMCGPQRDDFDIRLNGISLKMFGSQGQQRTAILSVKLSELDIMKEETDESPVLLLDDVMSELDSKRQQYLFDNLDEIQTFITCTDSAFFCGRIKGKSGFFYVEKGKVMRNDSPNNLQSAIN